ncbi:MAG: hypothetical protein HY747_07895 [Elusimicrobia bacterium]|nr:hypothetical protein [Elusimicrobiota bacterium]
MRQNSTRQKKYTEKLETIIKQMLTPLKNIPLPLVIEGISGKRLIPFNPKDSKDVKVLEILRDVAAMAGKKINERGILRPRPNEVGNDIEPFVKEALNRVGCRAETPTTSDGKKKSMGYPDIKFVDQFNRTNYLECKTFNIDNIATAQRSFYLSPSDDFKVTENAHHFLLSYEIFVKARKGRNNLYNCRSWKIISLENLDVDVKYEFNSDNVRLYARELVLAEGKI